MRLSLSDGAELSAYSTVTILWGSSLCTEPERRPGGRVHGVKGIRSSADMDARGDVRARRLLRRILTISVFSFSGWGDVGSDGVSSLLAVFPLAAPLLAGRCSFSELDGLDGLRGFGGAFFCPVLLPMYSARGRRGFDWGVTGAMGLSSGLAGFFGMILEGRTQALGIVLGCGRPAASFGGDILARQCESLMTRFLGAVAVSRSSSSSLWGTGVFFALPGRSGLAPTDFPRSCVGFQLGLSSCAFDLGVVAGLGEAAGLVDVSEADAPAPSLLAASGSTSCCQRFILSRTLAGLLMPMALAKSLPSMAACLSVAPIFLPGVPFLCCPAVLSGSLGRGEAGIESQCHWSCGQTSRGRGGLRRAGASVVVFCEGVADGPFPELRRTCLCAGGCGINDFDSECIGECGESCHPIRGER